MRKQFNAFASFQPRKEVIYGVNFFLVQSKTSEMPSLLFFFAGFCWATSMAADLSACAPNEPKVINTLFSMKGDIYSPGYQDGNYPNDLHCAYTIKAPFGFKIKLSFADFDIDPFDLCMKDMLIIHEGEDDDGPVHGIFCGNTIPNAIVSQGNSLHIVFVSDFLTGKKGFHLKYEAGIGHALCPTGKSPCKNRNCYTIAEKCNGVDECGDGTDEEDCDYVPTVTECGKPTIEPATSFTGSDRIIGGREAILGSWPWQADMQLSYYEPNGHICGGSLINAQWVVSAAHCVEGADPSHMRIHLGNHHKYYKNPNEQVRMVERIIVFPGFTGEELDNGIDMENDISLLKLNAPVKFTDYVKPVCMPKQGQEVVAGTKCMATGWGMTRGTGKTDVLKQVELSIRKGSECENEWMEFSNQTMVCVANDKGYQDVCHGDSGGPLVCKDGAEWYLHGATSFGTATNYESGLCALPEARTVYAKMSDKITWITRMLNIYS